MAKNLKLNIRNAQLAEALNLKKPRIKPPSSKQAGAVADAATAEARAEEIPARNPLEGTIVSTPAVTEGTAEASRPAASPKVESKAAPSQRDEPESVRPQAAPPPRPSKASTTPTMPYPHERQAAARAAAGPHVVARPALPNGNVRQRGAEVRRREPEAERKTYRGFGAPQEAPKGPVFKASASTMNYVKSMRPVEPPPPPPGAQGARQDRRPGTGMGGPRGSGAPSDRRPGMGPRDFGRAVTPRAPGGRGPGSGPPRGPRPPGAGRGGPPGSAPTLPPSKVAPSRLADRKDKKPGDKDRERGARRGGGGSGRGFDARDRQGLRVSDDEGWRKRRVRHSRSREPEVAPESEVTVKMPTSIKELAAQMKLKSAQVISKLFMQGLTLTLNDIIDDDDLVQLIGSEFGCTIHIDRREEQRLRVTSASIQEEIAAAPQESRAIRPPVITFMGHVDHGKTSLIDAIRSSNRAAGEAGAITQHIGAFRAQTSHGPVCILDTPGHEAFTEMRSRGASVTDLVVLVVAGDEGVLPQTVEAIRQAKEANVQIIVAVNKCDRPNFDMDMVYRQLSEHDLVPEAWGGSIVCVPTSAVTKEGLDVLLEILALQAEMMELQAHPEFRARGTVLESQMHKGFGCTATVLVQNGTLRLRDPTVFGNGWAKIKTMRDENGHTLQEAGPSTPVLVTGLSCLPDAGTEFVVVSSEREARDIAERRVAELRQATLTTKRPSFDGFLEQVAEKKTLRLVVKADVTGSLEALLQALNSIKSSKVSVEIVHSAVGEVSESDVVLAANAKALILGFHTHVESKAATLLRERGVELIMADVIYHVVDRVRDAMRGLLDKLEREVELGEAEVRALFRSSQLGSIAGCQVIQGVVKRNARARLLRGGQVLWRGGFNSLKRDKEDVREVAKGYDCGILLQGCQDYQIGDIIQAYELEYIAQDL